MCEKAGIKKCKSKNRENLINLLEKKPVQPKIEEKVETEIINEVIIQQEMEINKIYNEDCLATMSKMPDEYVDLIALRREYFKKNFLWENYVANVLEAYEAIV